MSWLAVADLAAVVAVLLPLAWSAAFALAREFARPREPHAAMSERAEQIALLMMAAPAALGAALVALAAAAPETASALPALGAFAPAPAIAPVAEPGQAGAAGGWMRYAGAAAMLAWTALVAWRIAALAHARVRLARIVAAAGEAGAWGEGVRLTDARVSPFATGRRTIVLPRTLTRAMSKDDVALILAHEREHLRRGDPAYVFALSFLEALFAADPFVRRQTARCRLAAELACDRAVTRSAPHMRKAYARALVAALKHTAGNAWHCAPAVFSSRNQGDYRMRIAQIMTPPAGGRKQASFLALGLAAALAAPAFMLQTSVAAGLAAGEIKTFAIAPLDGRLTAAYGVKVEGKTHDGVDIAAPEGTPIVAPAAGVVVRAEGAGGFGNVLDLDHGEGLVTRYAHLNNFEVAPGDRVAAGQLIARVGTSGVTTGPHVHIEIYRNGERIDPATMIALPGPCGKKAERVCAK